MKVTTSVELWELISNQRFYFVWSCKTFLLAYCECLYLLGYNIRGEPRDFAGINDIPMKNAKKNLYGSLKTFENEKKIV